LVALTFAAVAALDLGIVARFRTVARHVTFLLAIATSHVGRVGRLGAFARHVAFFLAVAADHDPLVGAVAGLVTFLVAVATEHRPAVLLGRTVLGEMTHWTHVSTTLMEKDSRTYFHRSCDTRRSLRNEALCNPQPYGRAVCSCDRCEVYALRELEG